MHNNMTLPVHILWRPQQCSESETSQRTCGQSVPRQHGLLQVSPRMWRVCRGTAGASSVPHTTPSAPVSGYKYTTVVMLASLTANATVYNIGDS